MRYRVIVFNKISSTLFNKDFVNLKELTNYIDNINNDFYEIGKIIKYKD